MGHGDALADTGGPSLEAVIAELGAREAERRRRAALALPGAAGAAGREACLEALGRQLLIEFHKGVREAVLLALTGLGGGDVAAMLGRIVCLEDADLRGGARPNCCAAGRRPPRCRGCGRCWRPSGG